MDRLNYTYWPAEIPESRDWQQKRPDGQTCAGVPRPFHTRRRPSQSTIDAFCRHQLPGSAYQAADCRLLVAELFRSLAYRPGMTSRKT